MSEIVLVTGINGYIASNIALQFAQLGYTIRGTSRAGSSEFVLRDLLESYGIPADRYQHVWVPSITEVRAFDSSVEGVHSIIHVASPIDFSISNLDSFLVPAVNGVENILRSALRYAGPQLKSVVLTSSIASIIDSGKHITPSTYAYSESDWNESSLSIARENFDTLNAYAASKTAAERAFWSFRETHHPPFAMAAINPGVVTGPPVIWPDEPAKLNATLKPVWDIYAGHAKTVPPPIGTATYIDVRDTATLHVWAALHPEQSDKQRYLVTNGKGPPQAVADILRVKFPDRDIVVGNPGEGYNAETYWYPADEPSAVASKAYEALGIKEFIRFDKTILDTIESIEKQWPGAAKNFKL